jgi:hypothetical protein
VETIERPNLKAPFRLLRLRCRRAEPVLPSKEIISNSSMLLGGGNRRIVEDSYKDPFWGDGGRKRR